MILGNSLEWLDFSMYGYSSVEISNQLFGGSRTAYWASFGLGFAARPVGAYVLGRLSDERSRKLSFIVSMLAMSTSTALMSAVPATCDGTGVKTYPYYCVSNLWAAAIPAISLRCVQGFSAGAAAGGVNVIQTELWSTTERSGAIVQATGVQNVSGGGASMLAAAVVYGLRAAMGGDRYAVWGWRIAFLIVVPPSLFASYLMHRSTPESNEFAKRDGHTEGGTFANEFAKRDVYTEGDNFIKESEGDSIIYPPDEGDGNCEIEQDYFPEEEAHTHLRDGHRQSSSDPENDGKTIPWWQLISILIFSQFAIAGFNNLGVFLVEFAQTNYGVAPDVSTLMQVVGKGVQIMMTPFAATLGDVRGWFWTSAFGGALCSLLAMPVMLAGSLGGARTVWFLVSFCLPAVSTLWILNAPLLATSVFPTGCRSRWTSLVLATAAAIQGFLPLVLEEIHSTYAQGGVLMAIAALGTIGIVWVHDQAKRGNVTIYQRPELY